MARMSGGAICTRSDDEICASESEGAPTRVSKRSEANPSKAFGLDINTPVGGQRTHSATVSAGRRGFPLVPRRSSLVPEPEYGLGTPVSVARCRRCLLEA